MFTVGWVCFCVPFTVISREERGATGQDVAVTLCRRGRPCAWTKNAKECLQLFRSTRYISLSRADVRFTVN